MSAPARAALAALLLPLAVAPARSGSWGIQPSAELIERYDTNVGLTTADPSGDFITRLGMELPVAWTGDRSTLSLAYRFGYDSYLDNRELNNLSQYARAGWGLDDERNRWDLYVSWGRTENPRLGAESGADAPPTPGADTGFQVTRTRSDFWIVSAGYGRSLSPAWSLTARLDGAAARYSDPQLAGNESYLAVLSADHTSSVWNTWNMGLRYSRFQAQGFPSADFSAVQGGAEHRLSRRLTANWILGAVLKQDQAVRGDTVQLGGVLSGTDRLFGNVGLSGSYRRSRWSLGYNRDFSSGSGIRVTVRRDAFSGSASWSLGRVDALSVSLSRSRTRGVALNLNTDTLQVGYSRPIGGGWSSQVAVGVIDQGNGGAGVGTYREEVYSVFFRYAGQRRT